MRNKNSQSSFGFPGFDHKKSLSFGGQQKAKGNPREARPITTKRPMHLVMKSTRAQGDHSFLRRIQILERTIIQLGAQTVVKVRDIAVAGNHLHLIIQPKSQRNYRRFVRAVTGIIPRLILGCNRGSPMKIAQFWDARPFTRIVNWGKDYFGLRKYLMKNRLDLTGMSRRSADEMFRAIAEFEKKTRLEPIGFGVFRAVLAT